MSDHGEWEERVDKKSGKTYYYNRQLRQTAWKKPTGSSEEAAAWVRRTDEKTGDVYFYNKITKVRSAVNPVSDSVVGVDATEKHKLKKHDDGIRKSLRMSGTPGGYGGSHRSLGFTDLLSAHSQPGGGSQRISRRHVSVKLGQLANFVKEHAPSDTNFDKLKAMRREERDPVEGNRMNLELMANKHNEYKETAPAALTFVQYAKKHFNTKKKGMFGGSYEIADLVTYSELPLKRALLKVSNNQVEKKAVAASKLIHKFMSTPNLNAEKVYKNIKGILAIAMHNAPQELRDEIFCQLLKHVSGNHDGRSLFKGWQLLTLFCGAFPPSKMLEPTLRNFIDENHENETQGQATMLVEAPRSDGEDMLAVADFADYARLRLDKSVEVGPRSQIPSTVEVQCVFERRPVDVSVYLVNGTEFKMQVDTWTTVQELLEAIGEHIDIKDISIFSLVEMSADMKEYILPVEDRVLDVLADWELENSQEGQIEFAANHRLIFRIRLFLEIPEEDKRASELAYYQAVFDVNDGRYPVQKEDLATLVAFVVQEKFGDYSAQEEDPLGTNEAVAELLPESFHKDVRELRGMITEVYKSLEGYTVIDCINGYLDLVQSWPTYGCMIYAVEPLNNAEYPAQCFISINAKAIALIDSKTQKFITQFPWSEIVTWGYSDVNSPGLSKKGRKRIENTFCLIMGNFMQQMKLFFQTPQAVDVYRLVEAYGNKIKGYKGNSNP